MFDNKSTKNNYCKDYLKYGFIFTLSKDELHP